VKKRLVCRIGKEKSFWAELKRKKEKKKKGHIWEIGEVRKKEDEDFVAYLQKSPLSKDAPGSIEKRFATSSAVEKIQRKERPVREQDGAVRVHLLKKAIAVKLKRRKNSRPKKAGLGRGEDGGEMLRTCEKTCWSGEGGRA